MDRIHRRPPGRPKMKENDTPIAEIILKTAMQMFIVHGYEGVSVDHVAKACSVTKATIYYHYQNKASLFTKSVLNLLEELCDDMFQTLDSAATLRERLIKIAQSRLEEPSAVIDFQGLLGEAGSALAPEQMSQIRAKEMRITSSLADLFEEAVTSGEIAPVDTVLAANAYLSLLIVGKAKDASGKRLFGTAKQAAVQIVSMLLDGLKHPQRAVQNSFS